MSAFFPDVANLAFSYATCGDSTIFGQPSDAGFVKTLLDESQRYMRSSQSEIVAALSAENLIMDDCPLSTRFCLECPECVSLQLWGDVRVLYSDVGFWLNQVQLVGEASAREAAATCLSSVMRGAFAKVRAAEGNEGRLGFQYFADQLTGSYTQMPHTDWCPSASYDPRRRPWYAAGATGPKDVVIVVDVSGSMDTRIGSGKRSDAARTATLALLDTLNWADFFNIILFSSCTTRFSKLVVQATDANLNDARSWIGKQSWEGGSTNYQAAFEAATGSLRDSRNAGSTSTCNRIILFLSDGEPDDWEEGDFNSLRHDAEQLGAVIFTYGLSSGADRSIIKRIACENKGIYYHLDDGVAEAGLASAMTSYFEYFAAGQRKCEASYLKYTDLITGAELYSTCRPFQNAAGLNPPVLGVACLDLNMLVDLDDLLEGDSASEFICHISAQTKQCLPLDFSECHLEQLRSTSDYAEQCGASVSTESCGCVDPNCADNLWFVDELGYYCDSWVGDNCEAGEQDYGYTRTGLEEVFSNCKRSCGLCPHVSDETVCRQDACAVQELPTSCRACNGVVPGVDLLGRTMHCPGDTYTPAAAGARDGGEDDCGLTLLMIILIVTASVVGCCCLGCGCYCCVLPSLHSWLVRRRFRAQSAKQAMYAATHAADDNQP